MADDKRCFNCEHFFEFAGDTEGQCRLNPPVFVQLVCKQIVEEDDQDPIDAASGIVPWYFPTVDGDDWCGQFVGRKSTTYTTVDSITIYPNLSVRKEGIYDNDR